MGIRNSITLLIALLFAAPLQAAGEKPGEVRKDVIYKTPPGGSLGLDLHYPSAPAPAGGYPLAVFFHGGGWSKGNKTIGNTGVRFLAVDALNRAGLCVASVDYRLCSRDGGITIHDCVTDCFDAVRYLAKNSGAFSLDAGQVFTIGDSAGGHLAQMVLLAPPAMFPGDPALADARFHLVAGVSWYGPCDFEKGELFRNPDGTGDAERFMERLLRGNESPEEKLATIRQLSPVNHLRADSPPLLMLHGDKDPTIPHHHTRHMKERADQLGAPVTALIVKNASHGWNPSGGEMSPSRDDIVEETVDFMRQLLRSGGTAAARPNIIHIVLDELGYYELSSMGHPDMRTPNIDRLAKEGMRFTQMLAGSAVCAPTRCSLLTGKHMGHASVRSNGGASPLLPGEPTIASVLKDAGYATGGFGKWGVGARGTSGVPEKHGFDVFFGYYDQVHAHTYYPRYLIRNSEEVPLKGNTGDTKTGETHAHYEIFRESMDFIRANKTGPFYLYLPWTPPHGHWGLPESEPSLDLYKDRDWPEDARIYAAMVNMVDRQIGGIRGLLEDLGLAGNTLILFTGDNGGQAYFKNKEHPRGIFAPNVDPVTGRDFRGGKGHLYEGGLRVPAIAWWPGKIAPGRVSDHLGYFPDVMPTFAEIAGAEAAKDIDGISFLPELLGKEQPQHEFLYWELNQQVAVRMGDWKAYRINPKADWELYDLSNDLGEQHDVAAANPQILDRMKAFAAKSHTPPVAGEILDRQLADKDRMYMQDGREKKVKK